MFQCPSPLCHAPSPQADDRVVPELIHSLRCCIERLLPTVPKTVQLKRFVAQSYIGLFLEDDGPAWLREAMKCFATDARRLGGCVWVCVGVCVGGN